MAWRTRKREELQFVAVAVCGISILFRTHIDTYLSGSTERSFKTDFSYYLHLLVNRPDGRTYSIIFVAKRARCALVMPCFLVCIAGAEHFRHLLASNQLSHLSIIDPSNINSPRRTGNIPIHDTLAGTGVIRRHLLQMLIKIVTPSTEIKSEFGPATDIAAIPHGNYSSEYLARDIEAQAAESHGKLLPPAESVEEGGGKIPAEANADTLSKTSEAATEVESEQWKLNWRSIFVWHCPVMVTSYAAMFYMAGLFCLLTGPIFEALWSDTTEESQPGLFAALAYLITLWVSVTLFFYCALHAPDSFEKKDDEREPDEHSRGIESTDCRGTDGDQAAHGK